VTFPAIIAPTRRKETIHFCRIHLSSAADSIGEQCAKYADGQAAEKVVNCFLHRLITSSVGRRVPEREARSGVSRMRATRRAPARNGRNKLSVAFASNGDEKGVRPACEKFLPVVVCVVKMASDVEEGTRKEIPARLKRRTRRRGSSGR